MRFIFFILLISFSILSCRPSSEPECGSESGGSMNQKTLCSLGDLTTDAPVGWLQFSERGKFCFYLPENYKEEDVQGIDSLAKHFDGEQGTIGIDYGMYSRTSSDVSGFIEGESVAVTLNQSKDLNGSFGAKNIYTLNLPVGETLSFNLTYYALAEKHLSLAKQIFGTVRIGENCP